MSEYRRAPIPGRAHFFTIATFGRRKVLTDDVLRGVLRRSIQRVREEMPFLIDAWVLLPDHMHCIWRLPEGDSDFDKRWSSIKERVTRELESPLITLSRSRRRRHEGGLWQPRFREHGIRDEVDFRRHMDYIHWNPVKHGYVDRAIDWPYSTFRRYVKAGVYPVDWGFGELSAECRVGE